MPRQTIYSRDDLRPNTLVTPAQIATAFRLVRAFNRQHGCDKNHQPPITHAFEKVLRAVLFMHHRDRGKRRDGRDFGPPSYDQLADYAGVSRSTVRRALPVLERAGILTWWRTFTWHKLGDGFKKAWRDVNAYLVTVEADSDRPTRSKPGATPPKISKVQTEPARIEDVALSLSKIADGRLGEALARLGARIIRPPTDPAAC